ncbi:AmmeMemoRadiSam system protein A [Candidatus Micrarchaeota archaeon]|nr:AmmeMemoRadiSam system protein A [Candidatus Micrarchaeota archaeon]MBU1930196.1 AmmeMemoRadiSam system protein A [Candidatus Micrarchaeota archaeon]
MLSEKEKKLVLKTCKETILSFLENRSPKLEIKVPAILLEKRGVFVTLSIKGKLRGCIGNLEPTASVWEGIQEYSLAAAFNDPRFSPLSKKEFAETKIEVSILSKPVPLEFDSPKELLKKIEQNVHGVILQNGFAKATFLPSVWEEISDKQEFLSHLCMKAGLDPSAWQDSQTLIWVYSAEKVTE